MPVYSPAPMIVAKTRKFVRRFEEANATSARNARTLEELNLRRSLIFMRYLKLGVFIEASPQRYFLSHENLYGYNERRRKRMTVVFAVLAIIVAIAMVYSYVTKS